MGKGDHTRNMFYSFFLKETETEGTSGLRKSDYFYFQWYCFDDKKKMMLTAAHSLSLPRSPSMGSLNSLIRCFKVHGKVCIKSVFITILPFLFFFCEARGLPTEKKRNK